MFRNLLKLLFPEKCSGCGSIGSAICRKCLVKIPLAQDSDEKKVFAIFDYGDKIIQKSIKELKYKRKSEAFQVLARESIPYIEEYIFSELQSNSLEEIIFVPIPEHKSKESWRGFNQSQILSEIISKSIPLSHTKNILIKNVETLPQARLRRTLRLKNVLNTMEVIGAIDPKIPYIIIDDVTTTGATFVEARRAMKNAGARKIFCIALAHGYSRK